MYEMFYGFSDKPFRITPDQNYFYDSNTHKKARSYIAYGIDRGDGFVVIIADSGLGKTILCKKIESESDSMIKKIIINTSSVNGDDLLRLIALKFDLKIEGYSKSEILVSIERQLHSLMSSGQRVVLLIDDAQALSVESLEQIKLLCDVQSNNKQIMQCVLFATDTLRELLNRPQMASFRQHIVSSCKINSLDSDDIKGYINFRLTKSGWRENPILSSEIYDMIFEYSLGNPRVINILMERVLLYCYIEDVDVVNSNVIRNVIRDIRGEYISHSDKDAVIGDENNSELTRDRQLHNAVERKANLLFANKKDQEENKLSNVTQQEPSLPVKRDNSTTSTQRKIANNKNDGVDVDSMMQTLSMVKNELDSAIVKKLSTIKYLDKVILKKRKEIASLQDTAQDEESILRDVEMSNYRS